ncbi:hypothetical protein F5148DRAFT_1302377 [Russula earlei]|uniref:Uncharacterized protein n=1 Tax=Russula earlei TaxID=71964 RepID=A0ACC0UP60_9AGAM|nr:hypothetical protein F5148DRAFT_1302377 [Russula earlei]
MLKIIRRISYGILRRDPPRSDDPIATSDAPTIGVKRKKCDEDEDMQESGSMQKRRGQLERQDTITSELGELEVKGSKGSGTDPGVKQVTRGVKEVELEDKKEGGRTDDATGTILEASKTMDGESSVGAALDPAHTPQNDDGPSQDVTVTDDKGLAGQSEAITEAPSNDPTGVEGPTTTNIEEPQQTEKERDPSDAIPEIGSDEVAEAKESDTPIPGP